MPEERRPAHVHGALGAGARGLAARDVHRRARRHLRGQSVFDPHARELLFRTPHWRIDGIGLLHLQHAFFRILADGAVDVVQGSINPD